MWEVNVEGAVSYTITFDCMTKTEVPHDYVIIVKVRSYLKMPPMVTENSSADWSATDMCMGEGRCRNIDTYHIRHVHYIIALFSARVL